MRVQLVAERITQSVRDEVAAAFGASMLAKVDTSGGMVEAVDCLAAGEFFRVLVDGVPVLFYVIECRESGGKREAEVTLAHGRADVDLVQVVLPVIERQAAAAGCSRMRIETRRAGLMKKLERAGYARASVILRKELQ
ncbi:hypothetical protein [Caballeronia sp. LZ016]|uniref:hypothetical protein n=1 Tax=Caballeronia sp. LZ016 TaxID=3038554 RepID=UPI0028602A94|nr:hypothetical protein [Caballeronia sp. LZ016]MDR5739494.1 hypothetical protein [Caballeronia sp. LZ016]